ncbi:hypothetical protein BaRGS_00003340 [Batillaria attramentaria]|uniref:Uncharacterized protein n=1 Tax=Batillaria attramentaria TaxID=370345 RepID=A0ABD0M100_9CAEN
MGLRCGKCLNAIPPSKSWVRRLLGGPNQKVPHTMSPERGNSGHGLPLDASNRKRLPLNRSPPGGVRNSFGREVTGHDTSSLCSFPQNSPPQFRNSHAKTWAFTLVPCFPALRQILLYHFLRL